MVLKNVIAYSASNLVSQVVTFASGFVLRRILPPEMMGIWNMAGVVRGYVQAVSLGALSGAARELPILRGREDAKAEHLCRSVAFSFSIVESIILAICVWVYTFWMREGFSPLEFYSLLAAGFLMTPARLQESYITFFQGAQLFTSLSLVLLIGGLVYAIALPIGAFWGGIPGLLGAALVSEMFRGVWLLSAGLRNGLSVSWIWEGKTWKRLVSYGVPYRLTDYPNTFFMMFDLLWVTKFMGLNGLGLYALAKGFYAQVSDITVRMGTVLYARTLTQVGQGVDPNKIGQDMRRFLQFQMLVSVPVVCWIAASIAPFLIRQLIPLYAGSIPVLLILLIGAFFISQNNNLFTIWIAKKRLLAYGISNLAGVWTVGLSVAGFWFLLGHRSLADVALASVLGYAGYFVYMMFTSGRELWGLTVAAKIFAQVAMSALWMAIVMDFGGQSEIHVGSWTDDLAYSAVAGLKMLIGIFPLVVFGLWVSGGGFYLYRMATASWKVRLERD